MYRHWYKRHRHNQQDSLGRYERRAGEGGTWEFCSAADARRALGHATAEELRREPGPARSEWGQFYRYVRNVSAERKAG